MTAGPVPGGPSRWTRGRPGADRGGGPVEMAIVLPLLLVCVLGVAHLSLYYLARQAALSTAQAAVAAERGWDSRPGAGRERARRFVDGLPRVLDEPRVSLACDGQPLVGRCDGSQVSVTVEGTARGVIPWLRHPVSRTATGPVERVAP